MQVLEETGIQLGEVHFAYTVNSVFEHNAKKLHYVTVFMRSEVHLVGFQPSFAQIGKALLTTCA